MTTKKIIRTAGVVTIVLVITVGSFVLGRATKKDPDSEKLLKAEAVIKVLGQELKRAQTRAESLAHSLGKVTQQLYEKEEEKKDK